MSKITPKNLSYDSTLPPFLARLQAGNSSSDGRHEFKVARPKKERTAAEIEDDDPVFFDEDTGDTLTKKEWEEREEFEGTAAGNEAAQASGEEVQKAAEQVQERDKVAAIGTSKKRKVGKVVGGEEDEGDEAEAKKKKPPLTASKEKDVKGKEVQGNTVKKGKKIKLSFGDDE